MLIYIVSPFRAFQDGECERSAESNRQRALYFRKLAAECGHYAIVPHVDLTEILDDNIPREREIGLKLGRSVIQYCEEIWVFGAYISIGMAYEILEAITLGKSITWYVDESLTGMIGDNVILYERACEVIRRANAA